MNCPLCTVNTEQLIWEDELCRVIQVNDEAHPGYCQVIWHEHVAEMSDLLPADREHLLKVVLATESALRHLLHPYKMNLASLGNMVPHLHWHLIPRYQDDSHFPQPIWGPQQRPGTIHPGAEAVALARAIDDALADSIHSDT